MRKGGIFGEIFHVARPARFVLTAESVRGTIPHPATGPRATLLLIDVVMIVFRACVAALCLVSLVGCASPYASDRLAATGGLAGAGIGAAVGSATGDTAAGAVIGTALGAVTGAAVGAEMDAQAAQNRAYIEHQLGRQMAGAVQIQDVIAMSQAGLSETVIITHIQAAGVAQPLSPNDMIVMKSNGVSDAVINAMQQPPRVAVVAPPPPPPAVIVEEHYWGPSRPYYWHHHHHRHRSARSHVHWGITF
jgi:hypothetical protein